MKVLEKSIILASNSPRRSQLLEQAGFKFRVKARSIDESYPAEMAPEKVAPYLAEKKAAAVMDFLEKPSDIILTADSVVLLNQQLYEKPKDYEDAVRILTALSGNAHQVITGVCLVSQEKKKVFSGVSTVYMDTLNKAEIDFYIQQYKPYDKAGAYAIQEWIGLCKISKIEGTYANIMGLPVDLVYQELSQF